MSTPDAQKKRDYSRYDQMSTAELEQILCLDFQASNNADSDLDAILYISDLLAKRSQPSDVDTAWEQFQTKYRPCADGRSLYDLDEGDRLPQPGETSHSPAPKPGRSRRRLPLRRLVLLAAILAACLLGGLAAAQAAGVDLFSAMVQTSQTFYSAPANSSRALQSNLDEEESQPIWPLVEKWGMEAQFPTWHPDGFTPGEPRVTDSSSSMAIHVPYHGENRFYSVTIQYYYEPDGNTGTFEKDDTPVERYEHNGQVFYILSNMDTLTATTYDGSFMTIIAGSLTRAEIKAIIDSIAFPWAAQNREQMREALAEDGQPFYCPQIPEGFHLANFDLYTDPITGEMSWTEGYTRGDQFLGLRVTNFKGDSDSIYEKDDSPVEEYVFHGITHYIFHNLDSTTAAWMVNHVEYSLWVSEGAVDLKELIRSSYSSPQ